MLWNSLNTNNKIPLIITPGQSLYFKDLIQIREKNKKTLKNLDGKAVAIRGNDISLTILLSLLDGVTSTLLLLPEDITADIKEKFYIKARVEFEVNLLKESLEIFEVSLASKNIKSNQNDRTNWIIPTSGTSGTPKLVAHNLVSLTKTTKFDKEIGQSIRWGLSYSINRFAGIQIMLQSLMSSSILLISSSEMSFSEQIHFFEKNNCNAISATPTFWRKLLMTEYADKLNLSLITLGGEIVDQHILNALLKKYPKAKITHIYASTEAGVGFAVKDGLEGFPVRYVENGVKGVDLKIRNDGTLMIKPNGKNQKILTQDNIVDNKGYIDSGDIVEKKDDRYVFLGRRSGSINVGGNKVMPEEVEKLLLNSGLIKGAKVYAKPNPIMGNLVCADVIPNSFSVDKKMLKKKLKTYCTNNIDKFKRPAFFNIVRDFDINQSGKITRK